MREHTKLRAFELVDEIAVLIYNVTIIMLQKGFQRMKFWD